MTGVNLQWHKEAPLRVNIPYISTSTCTKLVMGYESNYQEKIIFVGRLNVAAQVSDSEAVTCVAKRVR